MSDKELSDYIFDLLCENAKYDEWYNHLCDIFDEEESNKILCDNGLDGTVEDYDLLTSPIPIWWWLKQEAKQ